jgi:hypothetical protein
MGPLERNADESGLCEHGTYRTSYKECGGNWPMNMVNGRIATEGLLAAVYASMVGIDSCSVEPSM